MHRFAVLLYFLLATLSYTAIVITSTLMNLLEIPAASLGRQAFALAIYLSASARIYLLLYRELRRGDFVQIPDIRQAHSCGIFVPRNHTASMRLRLF